MDFRDIEGKTITIKDNASVYDTIRYIQELAYESATHPEIVRLSEAFRNCRNPLKEVFNYAYNNVVYKPDPDGIQQLRYAHRSLREGKGNCTDYTILISSLLLNLGIDHKLRVAAYEHPRLYEHIYPVAGNIVMDCVLGQKQDGSDTSNNRPDGKFNKEKKTRGQKDFKMKLQVLAGTKIGCACNESTSRRKQFSSAINGMSRTRDYFPIGRNSRVLGTGTTTLSCAPICAIKHPFSASAASKCIQECKAGVGYFKAIDLADYAKKDTTTTTPTGSGTGAGKEPQKIAMGNTEKYLLIGGGVLAAAGIVYVITKK